MTRRTAAVSALVVALVGATATATAATASTAPQHSQTFQARATAQPVQSDTAFAIAEEDVVGDEVIGHDVVTCRIGRTEDLCDVAFAQPAGLLYAHFAMRTADHTIAGVVVGGTRHYRQASGTLTGRSLSPSTISVTLTYTTDKES